MDAIVGRELLNFMDAYLGYNQIPLSKSDHAKTAFTVDQGLYCNQVIPFSFKNAKATYQQLMNKMFTPFIGKSMEMYVDDMLVKTCRASDHIKDLRDCFNTLRQYKIKLNPVKCAFGVESGKFLVFMVNHRGIEVNQVKSQAVVDLQPLRTTKEVQRLTWIVAGLSQFVSRFTNKCFSFFQALTGKGKINWDNKCEEAFEGLEMYLASPP